MQKNIIALIAGLTLIGSASANEEKIVITAGDSIAQGYGLALPGALGSAWKVVNEGRVSSGLAPRKGDDWVNELRRIARTRKPDVFILSFGANDAGMPAPGHAFGSDGWESYYSNKVKDAVEAAASSGAKVVWMPIPKMGREPLERNCATLRIIQNKAALDAGAIVPKLSSAAETSPNSMRSKDGVHFTMDGYRIAAYSGLAAAYPEIAKYSLTHSNEKKSTSGNQIHKKRTKVASKD